MKILSTSESKEWFISRGIKFISEEQISLPDEGHGRSFEILPWSRTQLVLSHHLARWFNYSEALLWMGVWTGYEPEEMELFLEIRQRYGDHRSLIDAPGHLFNKDSSESLRDITEILYFMMALNWEGYLLSNDQQIIIWMADEIIEVITQDSMKDKELCRILCNLDIKYDVTQL